MAVTFGQMAARIIRETARDDSFLESVYDSIITAIKELEIEQYWLFEKSELLTLYDNTNNVILPNDFSSVSTARLLVNDTYFTEVYGFTPVTNHEIFNYARQQTTGIPFIWAIFGNRIFVYPWSSGDYTIDLRYFYKDATYPVNYNDTSIWLEDLTEDLTRYKALATFYRDSLQAEEKSQFYEAKAMQIINNRRTNNNQRQTINRLSI